MLASAGAIGAAGLLAACGTDPAASTSTPPPIPTEAGDPGVSASPTTAGEPNVIKVTDIPVGGGKIYDEQRLVVTQPTAGTFKAFDSLCTHMGCVVTSIFAGKINCPCHQSQYSVVDGSVVEIFTSAGRSLTSRVYPVAAPDWTVHASADAVVHDLAPAIETVAS